MNYFFLPLRTSTTISIITNNTIKMPNPIPALKIPATASQEVNNVIAKTASSGKSFFILILC